MVPGPGMTRSSRRTRRPPIRTTLFTVLAATNALHSQRIPPTQHMLLHDRCGPRAAATSLEHDYGPMGVLVTAHIPTDMSTPSDTSPGSSDLGQAILWPSEATATSPRHGPTWDVPPQRVPTWDTSL